MELRCLNKKCNKVLNPRPGQKRLNPKRKYCDFRCQTRQNSVDKYFRLRDNPEYLKSKSDTIKLWYQKNRKHQNENVKKNYIKNPKKWKERQWVQYHRKKILLILSDKCYLCNKVGIKEIHHENYDFSKSLIMDEVCHNLIFMNIAKVYWDSVRNNATPDTTEIYEKRRNSCHFEMSVNI